MTVMTNGISRVALVGCEVGFVRAATNFKHVGHLCRRKTHVSGHYCVVFYTLWITRCSATSPDNARTFAMAGPGPRMVHRACFQASTALCYSSGCSGVRPSALW